MFAPYGFFFIGRTWRIHLVPGGTQPVKLVGLPASTYDLGVRAYFQGVGEVFLGYGDAAVGVATGAYTMVRHPIQTAKGVGNVIAHPVDTFNAIKEDVAEKSRTTRGLGGLFGDVFIGVATWATALKAAKELPKVAKLLEKIKGAKKAAPKTGGRLGKQSTRQHVTEVADELMRRGYEITGGGNKLPEKYIPGPGGARKGSAYPDITATKNGRTIHVNTVDTLKDGVTLTAREARNAAKLRKLKPSEHLITIPKPKEVYTCRNRSIYL